ncbi:MAG: nuclear transport factor 2 family protein, partial [Mycobacteriales bacterium]
MTGVAAVERFLDAYWSGDVEATLAACTEDFLWLNTALPKSRIEGHEGMQALMTSGAMGFPEPIEPGSGGHRTVCSASNGALVLHERVDFWDLRGAHME